MSTLWTPGGEFPVADRVPPASTPVPPSRPPGAAEDDEHTEQRQLEAEMAELQQQLAATPAAVVVANHCFGLFELAALHLSVQPPSLAEAQLAIDALAALLERLAGRLGDGEAQLGAGLTQLQLAFVQIRAAGQAQPPG